ncbi:hypothetical protein GCM10020000_80970 [Streptomyces olivoverticillatus]
MRVNRAWLGLVLLMLPTFLVALDTTAMLLALPRLSADLGAGGVEQLWISDVYGFAVASLVITMGTLGDRIGRRRLLLLGAAAFAVLSVVAAFAVDPLMLIVARALLGVAGATLAPSTLALITSMFRDEQPAREGDRALGELPVRRRRARPGACRVPAPVLLVGGRCFWSRCRRWRCC